MLAAVLALAAGCHALRQPELDVGDADVFTLSIVNHHRLNVTIYNVAQGRRERIGEVTAATTTPFRLHARRYPSSEIRLLADAVGSPESVQAELMHVEPGDVIEWTLESDLGRSMLIRR